jgi:hypothetical protein
MSRHIIRDEDVYPKVTQQSQHQKTEEEKLKESYIYSDHPSTMENGTATFFYIIIMLVGIIFIGRLLIWVTASIIYFRFINRYKIREEEWNKAQEKKRGIKK